MTSIYLASNKQETQQQPSVSIYWDYQNIPNLKIANNLLLFASSQGFILNHNAYNNWGETSKAKQTLEHLKWNCINVYRPIKNAVDFQLCIDCGSELSDKIILVLGDHYGEILIDDFHKKDKEVIVFAKKGSEDKTLRKLADQFYFIDELPSLVSGNTQTRTDVIQCQIIYNEAIEYLIEAIKTALSEGKRTVFSFSLIDNLMRQRFPKYKGVSSICTPDGKKKFSKFSKFVDAAVKDGKVRMQNQQLLLIEVDNQIT